MENERERERMKVLTKIQVHCHDSHFGCLLQRKCRRV
jgi:hypothetical protein